MDRFPFDHRKILQQSGNGRYSTVRGIIEVYQDLPKKGFIALEILGPTEGHRGTAILDRETARKVAVTLLKWVMI